MMANSTQDDRYGAALRAAVRVMERDLIPSGVWGRISVRTMAEAIQAALAAAEATTVSTEGSSSDVLCHKLIADLFDLPIWERGKDRVVTPPWRALTVAERDLIADALRQWRSNND